MFKDNGAGAGASNNGVQDGAEAGLVGMPVKVTDAAGSTVYDSTSSGHLGSYAAWVPSSAGAAVVKVVHTSTAEWLAISGNAGTTAGSFTQASATVAFTNASGASYSGVNFGDVPLNSFEPDGQQPLQPGAVVFFPHVYTAGSAGQLSLAATGAGAAGWSTTLYADANCNGLIDAGDLALTAAVPMVADQKLCIVAKVAAPPSAATNTQYAVSLAAHYAYANTTVVDDRARSDLATIGNASNSGLRLAKVVDKATAATGTLITYTLTYTNQSSTVLTALKIQDATPAYTVFSSAACGAVPNAQISCSLSTVPTAGAAGRLEWTFTGNLSAGASGTVSFSVLLQ